MNEDAVQAEQPATSVDKLVEIYIKIRDARDEVRREADKKEADLNAELDLVAQEILAICKQTGADSIKTKAGTAMRSVKSKYWTNDWESLYDCISENDVYGLLEKRIHQGNMKQFIEENPSLIPKGLNTDSEYSIVVTRSKSSS